MPPYRASDVLFLEGLPQLEPRCVRQLAFARRQIHFAVHFDWADELLLGGPDYHFHAAGRWFGVDFDGCVAAGCIEAFDCGAHICKPKRITWLPGEETIEIVRINRLV